MKSLRVIDFSALLIHVEVFSHLGEELFFAQTVKILHHTVVVDNLKVRFGEAYSEEEVIFFVACVIWVSQSLFVTHECGSCSAVVTVGYI